MRSNIFSLAVLFGSLGVSNAQDVTTEPNDETYATNGRKTLRVVAFPAKSDSETEAKFQSIFYSYKGKKVPLYTSVGTLSSNMPKPSEKILKLYSATETAVEGSEKKKITYKEVGAIPLVSGSKAILILIIPGDLTKAKIRGKSFKDSKSIHPKETARVFNMTKKVVAIRAGKQEAVKVDAGAEKLVKWKAQAYNSIAYKIAMEDKKAGNWAIIESAECAAPADMRTFVFVSGALIENRQVVTSSTFLDPITEDEHDTP